MPELIYTEGFVADVAQIRFESKRNEIKRRVDLLSGFPELGSPNLPRSLVEQYGDTVRKLVVSPFLIVYEYHEDEDTVYLLGLIHQRSAW
ncbi:MULTISPECIES: type II toxin-antitoxin system RelE/ParE family toxin [Gordonibacter]|uniref:Type II toxin-antitoxin system RelE/ParE family toxin n=1 Tax=Gordonibacter faecis TaxID=3047475 RepID=A0ABT7DT96_9ACTN|nr:MULTISPECIES: type II toxin-antitoxin system RelE/ParE family toxin [unclassified Gordonibacter]MDJ1651828.1 type II toxin-antitoxin system RelE/ParE family toxin [Gordonibacter sp. KGMB12511]HIW75639.1 type II toxin-antitoxin system RelE/ParE family toxin [Candidatus Gordonibacter avicola]